MIIVSRIIHVKVDRRLNVSNKIKYQRRLSSRLAIVMFRGTPCSVNRCNFKLDLTEAKFKEFEPRLKYGRLGST